jgi:hypothetical protein
MYLQKEISKKTLKKKHIFCWRLVSHWQKKSRIRIRKSAVRIRTQDPWQNVTNPQHWSQRHPTDSSWFPAEKFTVQYGFSWPTVYMVAKIIPTCPVLPPGTDTHLWI